MGAENVIGKIDARVQAQEQGGRVANDGSQRFTTDPAGFIAERPLTDEINVTAKYIGPKFEPNAGITKDRSQLSVLSFPSNIESGGIPYVLFKIFETKTGFVPLTDETSFAYANGASRFFNTLEGIPAGTAIAGAIVGGNLGGTVGAIGGAAATTETGQSIINRTVAPVLGTDPSGENSFTNLAKQNIRNFNLRRNIDQLELALAMFMPDGVSTNYDNEYEALSVTATLGAAGFAAQALGSGTGEISSVNPFIAEASAALASKLLGNDDIGKLGLFATTGLVRNPQLEMIYNSPVLRKFVFDFRLVPRNATEAALINNILFYLKFYSAPRLTEGTGGRYLIPPAQFEIEFYKGEHSQNEFLFKTKKCVLSGISVDYTPNGFATFKDGSPVETRLQLTFQETAIIDRTAVTEGY